MKIPLLNILWCLNRTEVEIYITGLNIRIFKRTCVPMTWTSRVMPPTSLYVCRYHVYITSLYRFSLPIIERVFSKVQTHLCADDLHLSRDASDIALCVNRLHFFNQPVLPWGSHLLRAFKHSIVCLESYIRLVTT